MSKYKTDVVYKMTQEAKGKGLEMGYLYFKNVPVTFAQVLKAVKKYQSDDTAYQLNLFIDAATMAKVEDIGLNKEFAEVGVTKIKKGANRGEFRYKLDEHNSGFADMFGARFDRNTVKRDKDGVLVKEYEPLKVLDAQGNPFDQEVGNGSVCHVKLFAYRNSDNMLVVMMDTVVVVDHVPYSRDNEYFDEELGITVKLDNTSQASTEPPQDDEIVEAPKAKAKVVKPAATPPEDDMDDAGCPF
jgi:hypothetical protein